MTSRRLLQYALLLVVIAGAVYAAASFWAESRKYAVVGEAAPSFTLTDLQGNEVRLADYKGKGVLLNFWASWCNPCVNELPLLNEAYKLSGVELLAVNVGDSQETAQKFAERYELSFPIVLDSKLKIKERYRAAGLPLTVLIDEEGTLLERHEGALTEMADILHMMERIKHD